MGVYLTYVDGETSHVVVRLLDRVMVLVQVLQHLDFTQDALLSDLTGSHVSRLVTFFSHYQDS